ncbi:hypothetical protein HQ865_10130 [Mucilaginibacter mali]|uniref:Uncharacterized protein n=1 Tax=Mucilaginibacter mali TaxID=2740462 RepID=A0A7D4ULL2_9SPHI|nr:hypothetical protein [Mucilaginibacter mali]QKJ30101.1 hypothetical protein HQ865_10130 [Mucilaginibacter mali]
MKTPIYTLAFVASIFLFSCGQGKKSNAINMGHLSEGKHCYVAALEGDSATLTFDIDKYGSIKGQLNINYQKADSAVASRENTAGDLIKGEFRGDTLFADYSFKSGKTGKEKYANPVALLHKGDTLVMGRGRIYEYLGRTYFDPKTPIDFSKSKFRFMPVECKK